MAGTGGLRLLPRPLEILLKGTPYDGDIIVQAELPKGSMNLCAVALVKQDRENDLFHIFDLEDRIECSA